MADNIGTGSARSKSRRRTAGRRGTLAALAAVIVLTGFSAPRIDAQRTSAPPAPIPLTDNVRIGGTSLSAASAASDRYIATFSDEASLDAAIARLGRTPTDVWRTAVYGFAAPLDAQQLAAVRAADGLLSVESDRPIEASTTQPNPPWGLDRIDQHSLPYNQSYTYTSTGYGVTAYVIDTGLRRTHTEFTGRVAAGGYWEFYDGYSQSDCAGHGTHVAGTLGGTTYGVAKQVTLVPVRVLDCNGNGSTSSVLAGINWAIDNHVAGTPAVANISIGGSASTTVDNAVQALINDGVTVVVAAGNDAAATCNYSPARLPAAITVAASDSTDDDAAFSNYGSCNDIFAPGVGILSAWWTSDYATNVIDGTSMASPHVAGVAALVLQGSPSASPATVWTTIEGLSTKGALSECCGDPDKLLYFGPTYTAPGAPTSVLGYPGNAQVEVVWFAPASDGNSPITGYTVTASPGGRTCSTGGVLSCTVTQLTNGTAYTFTVTATNLYGTSPPSAASSPRTPEAPLTPPDPPTGAFANAGNQYAIVSWVAPAYNGNSAITGYTATASPGNATCTTTGATFCTISPLTIGTQYTFTVTATNGIGTSSPSAASAPVTPYVPPAVPPAAPSAVHGTPGNAQATVAWTAPPHDGNLITGYTATASPGGATCSTLGALSCAITSIANGTAYTFTVIATNEFGDSPPSDASAPVTPSAISIIAMAPVRALDTRLGGVTADTLYAKIGVRTAGSVTELWIAGRGIGVPDDASAVVLNLTIVGPPKGGYATVYPCGTTLPNASNLNFVTGRTIANAVVAKVGDAGKVCLYTSVTAHFIIDVNGYAPGASSFLPLNPARLVDSRVGGTTVDGVGAAIGVRAEGSVTEILLPGRGGVPSDAEAVALNVTVVGPLAGGYATVFPCGTQPPGASNLNFVAGLTIANAVVAKIGAAGKVCIFASKATHLIVDVNGFFPAGAAFTALTPVRLLDSRPQRILANGVVEVTVAGIDDVPVDADAVVLNVTVAGPMTGGFITVYPCGSTRPNASSINYVAGQAIPNAVIAKVGTGGKVCIYTSASTNLLVDLNGFFPAP
ncbi:MAG: S8 family serine peptidase [Ilumatobacteraceae bacterium]